MSRTIFQDFNFFTASGPMGSGAFLCEHWLGVGDVRQGSVESCHKVVEFKSMDSTPAVERIGQPEVLYFLLR